MAKGSWPRGLSRKAFDAWFEGVRYPVWWSVSSWSTSIGSAIRHELHRRAAAFYARRYFLEHGHLPEGTHHVVVTVGRDIRGTDIGLCLPDNRFEADITYPPADPR
jgi:hypothetical protein